VPATRFPRIATRATVNPFCEVIVTTRKAITTTGAVACCAALLVAGALPAFAAGSSATPTLDGVISAIRVWAVGILAALATLMLTVAGILYVSAGGSPTQVEKAKTALRSALGGYALAALAPLLISILKSLVGAS
jgi:hypothetical protein